MKIKLYYILSGDVHGIYTITYEGNEVSINDIGEIVKKAKNQFNLPGKQYTVLASGKVFHVFKQKSKTWKAYELKEAEENGISNQDSSEEVTS